MSQDSSPPVSIHALFREPVFLHANPQYYDYIHHIDLEEGNQVKMVAGGCQAIRRVVHGRYEVSFPGPDEVLVRFFDLADVNPYQNNAVIAVLGEVSYKATLEFGPFAMATDIPANIPDERWPWVVSPFRVVFEEDPLAMGHKKLPPELLAHPEMQEFLKPILEGQEADRRYYVRGYVEEITYTEAVKRGLASTA